MAMLQHIFTLNHTPSCPLVEAFGNSGKEMNELLSHWVLQKQVLLQQVENSGYLTNTRRIWSSVLGLVCFTKCCRKMKKMISCHPTWWMCVTTNPLMFILSEMAFDMLSRKNRHGWYTIHSGVYQSP